jgi:hypothetical protein
MQAHNDMWKCMKKHILSGEYFSSLCGRTAAVGEFSRSEDVDLVSG